MSLLHGLTVWAKNAQIPYVGADWGFGSMKHMQSYNIVRLLHLGIVPLRLCL